MCKICDLAEATIQGLLVDDVLPPIAVATVRAVLIHPENEPQPVLSDKIAMLYYISHLAVRWAIRLKIHPRDYLETIYQVGKMEYELEIARIVAEKKAESSKN